MPTYTKKVLSGSDMGRPIGVSATQANAVGITIHATTTGTNTVDEVFIYAQNNYSQAAELILEWGTTATNAQVISEIPPKGAGPVLVMPGIPLQGSATALTIYGFVNLAASGSLVASSAFVTITGYVNRIVQS